MVKFIHIADIHFERKRRNEYNAVLEKLYSSIIKENPDIIVIAGDVFNDKMKASPHNFEDVARFLSTLVSIAPVILIAGNHDTNCLVPGSLDLLSPLVAIHRDLQSPRFTYWRNSGVYIAHDMVWTVIATDGIQPSVEDEQTLISQYDAKNIPHICIFHEEVNGGLLPNGQTMKDFKLTTSSFDRYDLALGGHIHLRQSFTPRAAYCGSLIQQNIGESHRGHGYIMWVLTESKDHPPYKTRPPIMRGVDIPNENGFVRIMLDEKGLDITPLPIPSSPIYWELIHDENTPINVVSQITLEYKTLFEKAPRAVRPRQTTQYQVEPGVTISENTEKISLMCAQTASGTIAAHEEIIRSILVDEKKDIVDAVINLHRQRWDEPVVQASGGKFRLKYFEFDNMYVFGPSNAIDFTSLERCVSGVVAPNHTGKSSLIEAILFALYEEHPRAPLKKDIIHAGATSCRMVLEFELDGKIGKIVKGLRSCKNTGPSEYRFEFAGENRTKGGTAETLTEIESVIGGSINALASSFQLQGGESIGFIGSTNTNRKKLIASVMTLGSFESIEKTVSKELTECGGELKVLNAQYRGISLDKIKESYDSLKNALGEISPKVTSYELLSDLAHKELISINYELGKISSEDIKIQLEYSNSATLVDMTICEDVVNKNLSQCDNIYDMTPEEETTSNKNTFEVASIRLIGVCPSREEILETKQAVSSIRFQVDRIKEQLDSTKKDEYKQGSFELALERLEKIKKTVADANVFMPLTFRDKPNHPSHKRNLLSNRSEIRRGPRPTLTEVIDAKNKLVDITPEERQLANKWNPDELIRLKNFINISTLSISVPLEEPKNCRVVALFPVGERRSIDGKSSTENEIKEAFNIYTTVSFDDNLANKWDSVEFRLLNNFIGELKSTQSTKHAHYILTQEYNKLLTSLGPIPDISRDTLRPHSGDTLQELQQIQNSLSEAKCIQRISSKLLLNERCSGCDNTKLILEVPTDLSLKLIEAENAHNHSIARTYYDNLDKLDIIKNQLCEINKDLENIEIHEQQITRSNYLSIAFEHYSKREAKQSAQLILEVANYNAARSAESWTIFDTEQLRRNQIQHMIDDAVVLLNIQISAQMQFERVSIINEALALIEISNYWDIQDSEEWKQYDTDISNWNREYEMAVNNNEMKNKNKLIESNLLLIEANNTLSQIKVLYERHIELKKEYIEMVNTYNLELNKLNESEKHLQSLIIRRESGISQLVWWRHKLNLLKTQEKEQQRFSMLSESAQDSTKKLKEVQNLVKEAEKNHILSQKNLSVEQKKELSYQRDIDRILSDIEYESNRLSLLEDVSNRYAALKVYRAILRPKGGIGDYLLERGRAAITTEISAALIELGAVFEFELTKEFDITIRNTGGAWLPASLGSGYQKFVLSLAARLAIWRLSTSPRPDAFIIDEGFGACDEEYLGVMADALEALACAPNGPLLVFLVSHVDILKDRVEKALKITVNLSGSRIMNTAPQAILTVDHKIDNVNTQISYMIPDPNKIGNIYCIACNQSLTTARGAKHIISEKHKKAFKKYKLKPAEKTKHT